MQCEIIKNSKLNVQTTHKGPMWPDQGKLNIVYYMMNSHFMI